MRRLRILACAALAVALAACAAPAPDTPALRLAPAALGRSLSQQQQVTMSGPDGRSRQVEVLLEADAQAVRLALLGPGSAARIEWDGQALRETRPPGWPATVSGERILAEMQLSLWPADAVRAALPDGWTLDETPGLRSLSWRGTPVVEVRTADAGHRTELVHLRAGYRLLIESRDLDGGAQAPKEIR